MRLAGSQRRSGCRGLACDGGWSLLEMLVVVTVFAILTLSAVPAYRSAMLRAQRTEATAALMALAAAQERFHVQHHTYAGEIAAAPPDGLGLPPITEGGRYAIDITSADAATFTATATARGQQARDAGCAEFRIDAAGVRSATTADCWPR